MKITTKTFYSYELFYSYEFSRKEKDAFNEMRNIAENICNIVPMCDRCPFQYFCDGDGDKFNISYALKELWENSEIKFED